MSEAEVKRFADALKTDSDLREAAKAAGNGGALITLAKSKGYNFTKDELKAFADSLKGELSEEQLEKIAGGDTAKVNTWIIAVNYLFV